MKLSTTFIALSATVANARSLYGLAGAPVSAAPAVATEPTAAERKLTGGLSSPSAYRWNYRADDEVEERKLNVGWTVANANYRADDESEERKLIGSGGVGFPHGQKNRADDDARKLSCGSCF